MWRASTPAGRSRGQTSLDFVVGMSVFFITVAFVLGFLPSILAPFEGDAEANVVVADRTAAQLSEGLLGSPATPGVLNRTCTVAFFDTFDDDGTDGPVGDCRFDHDAADLQAAVGVRSTTRLNVTIEDGGAIHDIDGQPLSAGDAPPESGDDVFAERVVLLDGDEWLLVVRVW